MSIKRRLAGLAAALAAGSAVSVVAIAPASATTVANHWNLASDGVDASGKTFTGPGSFTFATTFNGVVMTVNCTITGGFSYTTPSVSLHAAPYGAISIGIDPPDNVAPGNGSCTESAAGGPVAVSTTPGTRWPLTFLVPDASVPSPHDGPFTSTLTIPPNSVTVTMGFYPCTLVLPTSALPMSATYDGSTGTATKTGAATAFGVDNSSCVSAGAVGAMHSASVTLSEVGSPAKHPNIVYVP